MKIIKGVFIILIIFSCSMSAQEELDKMPSIKGGISELAKNVNYPKAAKEEGIMGKVFVKAKINENGDVIEVKVVKSVDEYLDAAAVKAVKLTKFIPGEKDGKKVTAEVTIPIKFKLDDKKENS